MNMIEAGGEADRPAALEASHGLQRLVQQRGVLPGVDHLADPPEGGIVDVSETDAEDQPAA